MPTFNVSMTLNKFDVYQTAEINQWDNTNNGNYTGIIIEDYYKMYCIRGKQRCILHQDKQWFNSVKSTRCYAGLSITKQNYI